ncbi:MAG: hypothetical protein U1B77_02135, partial [Dehalococcoidales bacterium]|nr:hypothetical protein [Dehalococcoidales bacterium]
MIRTVLALLGAFFLLLGASVPALAQPPSLPHFFYGELTINGAPAPAGTMVEARGTGVKQSEGNPLTTTASGIYGGEGALSPKLVVQGDISPGTTLSFFINGVAAGRTATWQSGEVTRLDLTVTIGS